MKRKGHDYQIVEQKIATYKPLLTICDDLEKLRIGLADLEILRNIVLQIAADNFLDPVDAFRKFVQDVQINYHAKIGLEGRIQMMTESLSAVRQEYESLMFERTKQQKVYDGAEELFDYGLTPPDILQIKEIIQASGIECRSIKQNLVQYGNWTTALHQIKTEVWNLKSEHDELLDRVSNLKTLEERITCKIESRIERQMTVERDFENHIKERVTAMAKAIKKTKIRYTIAEEQAKKRIQSLEAEERHKLDLFQKIDASLEMSPLAEAARGQPVDNESYRVALTRAIETMIPKLDLTIHSTLIA
ncbi:MAG: hypothetical protein ACRD8W_32715, partial [Nitrososphaeraceae archaeon]